LEDAKIELRALLGSSIVTVADLMNLKAGDVLETDFDGKLTVLAEDVPILRGDYGSSRGQHAVKVSEKVNRGRISTTPTP
jgi:flagellar motor switch protein FliM